MATTGKRKRPDDMATPPSSSLCDLPSLVWEKTCQFLDFRSIRQLYDTGGKPRDGCAAFFLHREGTFRVFSFSASGEGKIIDADRRTAELVGGLHRRATFFTDCFHIEPDTFRCLVKAFCQASSALQALTVIVTERDDGLDFLTCRESGACHWSQFLRACQSWGKHVSVTLDVSLEELESQEELDRLYGCPASDLRCRHLSRLDMADAYSSWPAHFPAATSAALFLSKFPNLQNLNLEGLSIRDSLLYQLAQTNTRLRRLDMHQYRPADDLALEHVSAAAWRNLAQACPDLEVHCTVQLWETEEQLRREAFRGERAPSSGTESGGCSGNGSQQFLCRTLKPSAPLTELTVVSVDHHSPLTIVHWCRAYTQSLRSITLRLMSKRGTCSSHLKLALTNFVARYEQFTSLDITEGVTLCSDTPVGNNADRDYVITITIQREKRVPQQLLQHSDVRAVHYPGHVRGHCALQRHSY